METDYFYYYFSYYYFKSGVRLIEVQGLAYIFPLLLLFQLPFLIFQERTEYCR